MPQKPMALRNLTESSFYTINLLVETMANKVEKAAANFTLGKLGYTDTAHCPKITVFVHRFRIEMFTKIKAFYKIK